MKYKRTVSWAPNSERYFAQLSVPYDKVGGTLLHLFESVEKPATPYSTIRPACRSVFTELDSAIVTCFEWFPTSSLPLCFAAGTSTGKVVVSSFECFDKEPSAPLSIVLHRAQDNQNGRTCSSLSWNPIKENLVLSAASGGKQKGNTSVHLWDISQTESRHSLSQFLAPGESGESSHQDGHSNVSSVSEELKDFKLRDRIAVVNKETQSYVQDESCYSLSWVYGNGEIAVAGCSRSLRILDIRKPQDEVYKIKTPVQLLSMDPLFETRVVTYSGDQTDSFLRVWDLRKFSQPIMHLSAASQVRSLSWAPSRAGVLSALMGSSSESYILHWLLRSNEEFLELMSQEELAQSSSSRSRNPAGSSAQGDALWVRRMDVGGDDVVSYSWHPHHPGRILTLGADDSHRDFVVHHSASLSFSPNGPLALSSDHILAETGLSEGSVHIGDGNGDICDVMRERAIRGYMLDPDKNFDISCKMGFQDVARAWQLVARMMVKDVAGDPQVGSATIEGQGGHKGQPRDLMFGIAQVLGALPKGKRIEKTMLRSTRDRGAGRATGSTQRAQEDQTKESKSSGESAGSASDLTFAVYLSDARLRILKVCDYDFGTGYDDDGDFAGSEVLEKKVTHMLRKQLFDQAAFTRLLQVDLSSALECLHKGAAFSSSSSEALAASYSMAAMSMAGSIHPQCPVWKRSYLQMMDSCKSPYLRACFQILVKDYESILRSEQISVSDRIAFAARFLSDEELVSAIQRMIEVKVSTGQLDGLVLTGLTKEAIPLLNKFVENTADLQTASLLLCCFSADALQEGSSKEPRQGAGNSSMPVWELWLEEYRDLLDRWQLWEVRAVLDIAIADRVLVARKPPAEVHIACSSCGMPITLALKETSQANGGSRQALDANEHNSPTVCRSCSAELPRCCLCLMPMGCSNVPLSSAEADFPRLLQVISETPTASSSSEVCRPLYSRAELDSWFAWCAQCQHGGHVAHLREWFRLHRECPVSGCQCLCLSYSDYRA
mmetsp:Transcript_31302/g.100389  ORF Transcript_31302/g.100389 Transcript_31302/m.100389 type:complete len:1004 (-) Transcript_31302:2-3013(-)